MGIFSPDEVGTAAQSFRKFRQISSEKHKSTIGKFREAKEGISGKKEGEIRDRKEKKQKIKLYSLRDTWLHFLP